MNDYSQNKEQEVIFNYFNGRIGRFLDVGAFNGKDMSNTLGLVEYGWSGVCVEASKTCFQSLYDLHKSNKFIITLNYTLSDNTEMVKLFDSNGDGASTTVKSLKDQWQRGGHCNFTETMVQGISSTDLLKMVGNKFDFVSIDTEWTSSRNFINLIKAGIEFDLLCLEHDDMADLIVKNLPGNLKEYTRNSVNIFIVKK